MKSILTGILASLFFCFTFVLNSEMGAAGGHWIWSSSLRFIFMLPVLAIYLLLKGQIKQTIDVIKEEPKKWLFWSIIGFGVFYTTLTYSASFTESWIVASTWQLSIVTGVILTPLIYKDSDDESLKKIPFIPLIFSTIILIGIFIVNYQPDTIFTMHLFVNSIIPIVIAAFAYPLGNRKTTLIANDRLTSTQRVFAMTLCSMPLWIILCGYAVFNNILPSTQQLQQSFAVAIFSGIIGTVLFFKACQDQKSHPVKLAIVESTQSFEIIFTILLGFIFYQQALPSLFGMVGVAMIILGVILNSFAPSIYTQLEKHKKRS